VEEHFVFFATYFIKRNSFYITSKGTITSPPPLLVWFCEAMGNEVRQEALHALLVDLYVAVIG
jgi:hypothetical protein